LKQWEVRSKISKCPVPSNEERPVLKIIYFLILLFSINTQAARFTNRFVEFEAPEKWRCTLEGAEWICQSEDPTKVRDAMIILAAKLRGDQDTLDSYLDYLKKPKFYTSLRGKPVKSEVIRSTRTEIGEHQWADALHLESEIPGYYTRYLATVKEDIAVLVTYSIDKKKYLIYRKVFEEMVTTLRVFRRPGMGLNRPADTDIFGLAKQVWGKSPLSGNSGGPSPLGKNDGADGGRGYGKKDGKGMNLTFILIMLGFAAILIFTLKKRKG